VIHEDLYGTAKMALR